MNTAIYNDFLLQNPNSSHLSLNDLENKFNIYNKENNTNLDFKEFLISFENLKEKNHLPIDAKEKGYENNISFIDRFTLVNNQIEYFIKNTLNDSDNKINFDDKTILMISLLSYNGKNTSKEQFLENINNILNKILFNLSSIEILDNGNEIFISTSDNSDIFKAKLYENIHNLNDFDIKKYQKTNLGDVSLSKFNKINFDDLLNKYSLRKKEIIYDNIDDDEKHIMNNEEKKIFNSQTIEFIFNKIKLNGKLIGNVDSGNLYDKLCITSIKQDAKNLFLINEMEWTENILIESIKIDISLIGIIPRNKLTKKILLVAFKQDEVSIENFSGKDKEWLEKVNDKIDIKNTELEHILIKLKRKSESKLNSEQSILKYDIINKLSKDCDLNTPFIIKQIHHIEESMMSSILIRITSIIEDNVDVFQSKEKIEKKQYLLSPLLEFGI